MNEGITLSYDIRESTNPLPIVRLGQGVIDDPTKPVVDK